MHRQKRIKLRCWKIQRREKLQCVAFFILETQVKVLHSKDHREVDKILFLARQVHLYIISGRVSDVQKLIKTCKRCQSICVHEVGRGSNW